MTSLGPIDKRVLAELMCHTFQCFFVFFSPFGVFILGPVSLSACVKGGGVAEPGSGQHARHGETRDDGGGGGLRGQTQRAVAV